MYYIVVAALMIVLPLLSVGVEASTIGAAVGAALIGKWFVFWAVGCLFMPSWQLAAALVLLWVCVSALPT